MALTVGIDIGGTFTDVVVQDNTTGELIFSKVLSTPHDFAKGFWKAFDKVFEQLGPTDDVQRLIHGTTVATNVIVEHKGARVGILTTAGFKDVIIMGRQFRSDQYGLFYDAETPTFLCKRQRIMGIRERLDHKGNVLIPLNEADVVEAVDFLVRGQGVQAIAVCYLFSFVNATHERRTEQIIREHYPKVRVSLSSSINPRMREYERIVITAFDAYIGPQMEEYIRGLEEGIRRRNLNVVLQVMQSRGGITSAAMCTQKPILTLLSGPAAGVASGVFMSRLTGRENLITLDMGGTSNDVALIRHGKPYLTIESKLGKYPLRQAMIDMVTIGAGGGSIAWVDSAGGLRVGPQSAGADPGPACYARGGEEPTISDASLILGYLNPEYFGTGELTLQPELAQKAIQERIAKRLGMSVIDAAAGILTVIINNMADQIRLASVHKGYHPKDFGLLAFGGAGPLVAGQIMQILGMKEVIVPISPGVLSALGLLAADIEHEEVASFAAKADEVDPKDLMRVFSELYERCEEKRAGVGISETELRIYRSTEMRYVGQSYELEVPFPEGKGEITREIIEDIVKRFHNVHQSIYQHSAPDAPVEFIAFRTVFSQKPQPALTFRKLKPGSEATPKGWRHVYFEGKGVDTPLYERAVLILVSGQEIDGPAIVEQEDTTTVIYPGQQAKVDEWGNLILRLK